MPMKIITLKLNHHLDFPNSKGATSKNPLKTVYHKTLRIVTSKINTAIVLKMEQFCYTAAMEQKDADGMENDSAV